MFPASTLIVSFFTLVVFGVYRAPIWLWAVFLSFITAVLWRYGLVPPAGGQTFYTVAVIGAGFLAILLSFFSAAPLRRIFFVKPIYKKIKKQMPRVSPIEKDALDAGGVGFEAGFFTGNPSWERLRKIPPMHLTGEEWDFLGGPAEELCRMIDDWDIRHTRGEIPDTVWNFAQKHGFLGLRIPKKYGGKGFSFQAQSIILGKIASRSLDVSTIVEVPNSLGPDELLEQYGTEKQKMFYLPRLARGEEIPSFAITSQWGGSDAANMRDAGFMEYGEHEGKRTLGIRLTWDKRYITFAPKATVIVLAFHLFDPDRLLEGNEDIGITLALIPARHPGVEIGRRHHLGGVVFPNGPIRGTDVFIPLDWMIGGRQGAGRGWKMLMECLFVGRAVSLPSMSTASVKALLRHTSAYARIRRQFGKPVGSIEGVEEALVRMAKMAYIAEAARAVTASTIDTGERPLAVASLMKYQMTEFARRAVNDAMDIHAGRAVCDGPANYLQSAYAMAPIGIAVEGANIVTRSLITFAQGVLRAHPYLYAEFEGARDADEKRGLTVFENAFLEHISLLLSNICRSFFHGLTGGIFGHAPRSVPQQVKKRYRQLWRYSIHFALAADVTALFLGGQLKKKQKIGGRLADALSELYLLSSVLKRYEDDGFPESDWPLVAVCMEDGFYRLEQALAGVVRNFPVKVARPVLKTLIFPFGARKVPASDTDGTQAVRCLLEPGEQRDRLTRYVFVSKNTKDATGLLECALEKAKETEQSRKKVEAALRSGTLKRFHGMDWIGAAKRRGILTEAEALALQEAESLIDRAIAVDDFAYNE